MSLALRLLSIGLALGGCAPPAPPVTQPFRLPPSPSPSPTATPRPVTSPPPVAGESPYPYPTPAMPLVGAHEIAGTVLSRGLPAEGIELTVLNERGRTYRTRTDAQGVYRMGDLPSGTYYAHFYNDRDNAKVGYWRTRSLEVNDTHGAAFPAWDVYLVGMRNQPAQGASVAFPFTVRFEPYPLAITYRFRIHDRGGPGGQPLFISEKVPARGVASFTFDGIANQGAGGALGSGRYLWGYQWEAGMAGEGGCLFQDFVFPAGR